MKVQPVLYPRSVPSFATKFAPPVAITLLKRTKLTVTSPLAFIILPPLNFDGLAHVPLQVKIPLIVSIPMDVSALVPNVRLLYVPDPLIPALLEKVTLLKLLPFPYNDAAPVVELKLMLLYI